MSKDDYSYDGAVVLQTPVQIRDDHNEVITIYGILYNKEKMHKDDLWGWGINRYICYLQSCERAQENGCRLAPKMIITASDNMIALNYRLKSLIHRIMKEDMSSYRLIEVIEPFVIYPDEVEGTFIISKEFIDRIQNNGK